MPNVFLNLNYHGDKAPRDRFLLKTGGCSCDASDSAAIHLARRDGSMDSNWGEFNRKSLFRGGGLNFSINLSVR
jgi:hypothetical protein